MIVPPVESLAIARTTVCRSPKLFSQATRGGVLTGRACRRRAPRIASAAVTTTAAIIGGPIELRAEGLVVTIKASIYQAATRHVRWSRCGQGVDRAAAL